MQVCPELLNLAKATLQAAKSMLALASTTAGHFPPSSKMQGMRFFAAASATSFPF